MCLVKAAHGLREAVARVVWSIDPEHTVYGRDDRGQSLSLRRITARWRSKGVEAGGSSTR